MPPIVRRKSSAYVTGGAWRLIFRHVAFPAAGLKVPAGTIDDGESPVAAALREAQEETGLTRLCLVRALGERVWRLRDGDRDEMHHRSFFHLVHDGDTPPIWRHCEVDPCEGGGPYEFELFWAALPYGLLALIAGHDALLPELRASLREIQGP